mgnify:CR=1 FL=1
MIKWEFFVSKVCTMKKQALLGSPGTLIEKDFISCWPFIDIKFFKRCLFVGIIILFPQTLATLVFNGIIWSIVFAVASSVVIVIYGYYLFNRVKNDVEYITENVESLYLKPNQFESIKKRFENKYIQNLFHQK